tara:strand:+ start:35875 stop:37230 length:1356 start_codon:yes stop_codon:yes gene_type:complete
MNVFPHKILLILKTIALKAHTFAGIFLLISFFISSCASQKQSLKKIDKELGSETFQQSFMGLVVYDLDTKKYIYQYNEEKYFTPASNVKLLTFYAALKELKDSIPGIRYFTTKDSLIFWGTGDPSFLYSEIGNSKVFDFLKNNSRELYLADNITTPEIFGPGWAWDDYNDSYATERSTYPIYGNLVEFTYSEDSIPSIIPTYFQPNLKMDNSLIPSIKRELESNTFKFRLQDNSETKKLAIPFKTSSALTALLLSDTLKRPVKVIPYSKKYSVKNSDVIYSVAADSLYKRMLHESDNFIAEQLLLLISEKISDTLNSNIAIDHIQKTYFKDLPDKINWVDGSGLSRYNLITPRTLITILEKISKEIPQEKVFALLPSGGKTGNLKNWYINEETYVFAKTGSLRNNHNLSGFLKTRSGKVLIFSFMNNNYVIPSSEIKKSMEKILLEFYNSY